MNNKMEFHGHIRKPMPRSVKELNKKDCRIVQPFSTQSMQKNTRVKPPPKCTPMKLKPSTKSIFRIYYSRGDLPIALDTNRDIFWKVDISELDYHYYLPMFFEGLCEHKEPYITFARKGVKDMLTYGGPRIFPCVPQLIIPIKNALNTRNRDVMISTMKVLQHLVKSGDNIGEALVPYYRQILPLLNLYKEKNVNTGAGIDHTQMRGENIGDVVNETLEILEEHGGQDAFINIKYIIPTYESCMMN